MELNDTDDIATDHNQEQQTPQGEQRENKLMRQQNEQWNESKFQKQLNLNAAKMQIAECQGKQQVQRNRQTSENNNNERELNQTYLNDKNMIQANLEQTRRGDNRQKQSQNHQLEQLKQKQVSEEEKANELMQHLNQTQQIVKEDKQEQYPKKEAQQENIGTQSNVNEQQQPNQLSLISNKPQTVSRFSSQWKSPSIKLTQDRTQAEQDKFYYQNFKLILTQPITSTVSSITFRLDNIKYCVGVGVALKQIVEKHEYDYKSTTASQLGHGLYLVTSQGYSWSHSEEQDDDAFREGFNVLYTGVNLSVKLQGQNLTISWKKGSFTMILPSRIRQKYTLCFCAYLHDKTDAVSIN